MGWLHLKDPQQKNLNVKCLKVNIMMTVMAQIKLQQFVIVQMTALFLRYCFEMIFIFVYLLILDMESYL